MDDLIFDEDNKALANYLKTNPEYSLSYNHERRFWEGKYKSVKERYYFIITYSALYPALPPKIYCYYDEKYLKRINNPLWKHHQYIDGSQCLFPLDSGESGWKYRYRLDIFLEKFKIFINQVENGIISTKHTSIKFQIGDYALIDEFYIDMKYLVELQKTRPDVVDFGIFNKAANFHPKNPQKIIGYFLKPDSFEKMVIPRADSAKLILLNNRQFKILKKQISDTSSLQTFLISLGIELVQSKQIEHFFFVHERNPKVPCFFVHFIRTLLKSQHSYSLVTRKYSLIEALYKRQSDLGEGILEKIKSINIIVIGLGTLGAKISGQLIRNGIKNIVLFDAGIYEFENVVRGVMPLHSVGLTKAKSMEDYLKSISPDLNIIAYSASPLHPLLKKKFIDHLKVCDLVISAIDSEIDELEMNKICFDLKKPIIFTVCLDNARFGRIYRVIPKLTSCLECINYYNELDPDKYPSMISSKKNENPYDNPGIPGINLDIREIANKTTRFVFQTLSEKFKLQDFFKPVSYDHFLLSNYQGWIFEKPYMLKPISYPNWDKCPVCGNNE